MHGCCTRYHIRIQLSGVVLAFLATWTPLLGQELEPRAYASAPVGLHVVLGVYSQSDGSILFDPTLPAEDATAGVNAVVLGYFQSFDLFGRFANIGLSVPYASIPRPRMENGNWSASPRIAGCSRR